jgi:imidazolonepropionase-like amidohydrolase
MTHTVIHADRLVTGRDKTVLTPGSIAIEGDRISWVGTPHDPATRTHEHAMARVLHLSGTTLLPGLIEAHTHLCFGAQATAPADPIRAAADAAAELLSVGVTTARDLGAHHSVTAAALPAFGTGPRIITAGVPLTTRAGHCHALGGAITDPLEAERVIAFNLEHGAQWIKVMVTGGFTGNGASSPYHHQFSNRHLEAIMSIARGYQVPVAAHAHGTDGVRQALDLGMDTLEHCTWMTPDGFDLDLNLVDRLARARTPVCPTINHAARHATGRLPWNVRRAHLRVMIEAGVRLIPGTDSGIPNTPYHLFAHSLAGYTDLGMDPLEVIEAATGHSAHAIGIGALTGALTPGKSADLIAVTGDPTTDLAALVNPVMVMVAGRIHQAVSTPDSDSDSPTERPRP